MYCKSQKQILKFYPKTSKKQNIFSKIRTHNSRFGAFVVSAP